MLNGFEFVTRVIAVNKIVMVNTSTKSWAFRQFLLPAKSDKRVLCHFVLFISERQICSFTYFRFFSLIESRVVARSRVVIVNYFFT